MAKYKLNDQMLFGKYTGMYVRDIIKNDPNYIEWLLGNTIMFEVNDDVLNALNELKDD